MNLKTFNDVKVFAGDNFDPPSDASYKNLVWENLPVPDTFLSLDTPNLVSQQNKNSCKKLKIVNFFYFFFW